jgi:hypothetical protein
VRHLFRIFNGFSDIQFEVLFMFSSVCPVEGGSKTLSCINFTYFNVQTHSYSLLVIPFSLAVILSCISTAVEVILWPRNTFFPRVPEAYSHVYGGNSVRVAIYNSKFTVTILFRIAHSNSKLTGSVFPVSLLVTSSCSASRGVTPTLGDVRNEC